MVSGTKFIDELRKAPEDVLSFAEAVDGSEVTFIFWPKEFRMQHIM